MNIPNAEFWVYTNNPLGATGSTVQEVKVVNENWDPVSVQDTNN